jgi:hypothetical protein
MRRRLSFLAGVFALAVGIGIGAAPTQTQADPCGPCWLKCINGEEAICCAPVQFCGCVIIQGSECEF